MLVLIEMEHFRKICVPFSSQRFFQDWDCPGIRSNGIRIIPGFNEITKILGSARMGPG
jgi:hypothetical protein